MSLLDVSQMLGNFGEFFGAIAVVVTLIYLAGQLRQNTRALRSSTYEAWQQSTGAWSDYAAHYAAEIQAIEERGWGALTQSIWQNMARRLLLATYATVQKQPTRSSATAAKP